jgi:hypothetical protein
VRRRGEGGRVAEWRWLYEGDLKGKRGVRKERKNEVVKSEQCEGMKGKNRCAQIGLGFSLHHANHAKKRVQRLRH